MHKKWFFVIALVSFVPSEVFSDGKLQGMADIVKHMSTSRLCAYDCMPVVKVNGTKLNVSFETYVIDGVDTDDLCDCMTDYMMKAVGDATSECVVKKEQFLIVFHGDYDPNVKPLPPLTTLANAISNFEEPDLGSYKCSQEVTEKDGRISIKIEYHGKFYRTACVDIIKYLNQNDFLGTTRTKCAVYNESEKVVVILWSDE